MPPASSGLGPSTLACLHHLQVPGASTQRPLMGLTGLPHAFYHLPEPADSRSPFSPVLLKPYVPMIPAKLVEKRILIH